MTNTKQQLHNMYIGLVCVYWANQDTKMGTAKQKALQQMQSFSKTVDKKNPISREISEQIAQMSKSVSKQIMTDKSSEMILDKKQAPQYKSFGANQVAQSKKMLNEIIQRAQKNQDMSMKKDASQYRASKTNAPAKAPQQNGQQKMNPELLMRLLMQQRMQNVA